jgi:hypothetical protein
MLDSMPGSTKANSVVKGSGGPGAGPWRDAAVFALFAALLIAAAWIVGLAAGPFEGDPDYIYMLNGLELLTLRSPSYYTHPGTPVELIGAIVIALVWTASFIRHGFSNLQDHLLAHPVLYMSTINAVFILGNAGALVFFMARVRAASGRLFPALVGALSLFLPASSFLAIHRVTAEPVLLAGCLVVAGILAPVALAAETFPETRKFNVALGAAIGFCIAVKATAAPLLLMILLLRNGESRKIALAASIVSAVALTLPVAPHYLEMTLWYVGLFTHHDGYGTGAVGAPAVSELAAAAQTLIAAMPETFVCLILYGAAMAARRSGRFFLPENGARMLMFSALFICADLLLVLKQPTVRYTIPTVPFLCLGNAVLAQPLFRVGPDWRKWAVAGLLAALALWGGRIRTEHLADIRQAGQALLDKAAASFCLVTPYYAANLVSYELIFGDGWTQDIYRDRLARLDPGFVSYEVGTGLFRKFSGLMDRRETLALFARQKCVWLVGSPRARFAHFGITPQGLSLVGQSPGDPAEAVAIYALKPGWEQGAGK